MTKNVFTLFLFISLFSFNAKACPSLAKARSEYQSGKTGEAIEALECIRKSEPENTDAQRLLLDIYWWEGHIDSLESLAHSLYENEKTKNDFEFRSHLALISNRFHLSANVDYFSGSSLTSTQSGAEERAEIDYRDSFKNHYFLGYSRLGRIFSGATELVDNNISAGFVKLLNSRNYIETRAGYSLTSLFSPTWYAGIEPHHVFQNETDLSVGYQFSNYSTLNTSMVTVSGMRPLGESLIANVKIYALSTNHLLLSAQGSLKWILTPRTFLKGFGGGGQTLEAPGLENPFYSLGGELGYKVRPDLLVRLDSSYYNSSFRNELRVGLGADWLF